MSLWTSIQPYLGPIGRAIATFGGSSTTSQTAPPVSTSTNASLSVGIDPLPEITAGLNLADEAAKLGLTIEEYKNTPAYLAAVEAAQKKAALDQIRTEEQKAEAGDPDALNEIRKEVS